MKGPDIITTKVYCDKEYYEYVLSSLYCDFLEFGLLRWLLFAFPFSMRPNTHPTHHCREKKEKENSDGLMACMYVWLTLETQ